jgi:hypothetical protein
LADLEAEASAVRERIAEIKETGDVSSKCHVD